MHKKAQFIINPKIWALFITLGLIFSGLLVLNYKGYIDFSKFNPALVDTSPYKGSSLQCPKTSAEMGTPCCTVSGTGEIRPAVSAVYISASCKDCPSDTEFLMMAPEGGGNLYKICECKCT